MPEEESDEEKEGKKAGDQKDKKDGEKAKKGGKKDPDADKIIMEASIDCEDCRYKIYKAIIGFPGIDEINIDMKSQKVSVKGDVDAQKLFEKVRKKSGGRVIKLLQVPEEKKSQKKEDKKPKDVTVVLEVNIDCHSCKKRVEKAVWDISGVEGLKVDGHKVVIKGKDLDPKEVCELVMRNSKKHAQIVPEKKGSEDKKGKGQKEASEKAKKGGGDDKEEDEEGDKKRGGGEEAKKKEGGGDKKGERQSSRPLASPAFEYFTDENPNTCAVM